MSSKLTLATELIGGSFEVGHILSTRKRGGKMGRLVKRQTFLVETLTGVVASGQIPYAIVNFQGLSL